VSATSGVERTLAGAPIWWVRVNIRGARIGSWAASGLEAAPRLPGKLLDGGQLLLTSMDDSPDALIALLEEAIAELKQQSWGL
jgi:hypothetical protein